MKYYIPYTKMQSMLVNNEPFNGNSVTAMKEYMGDGKFIYYVYSYSTLMYKYDSRTNESYFDNKFYSMTTSKIQNMLIRVYNCNNGVEKRDK